MALGEEVISKWFALGLTAVSSPFHFFLLQICYKIEEKNVQTIIKEFLPLIHSAIFTNELEILSTKTR